MKQNGKYKKKTNPISSNIPKTERNERSTAGSLAAAAAAAARAKFAIYLVIKSKSQ